MSDINSTSTNHSDVYRKVTDANHTTPPTPPTATPPMKCCLYLRVSTLDQRCDLQRRELTEYAQRRGWIITETYCDLGISGSKASRPELDRLMRDAAMARFSTVLVWKLDRFGRSVRNCLDGIEALRGHGVRFLAVSQSIDTD